MKNKGLEEGVVLSDFSKKPLGKLTWKKFKVYTTFAVTIALLPVLTSNSNKLFKTVGIQMPCQQRQLM